MLYIFIPAVGLIVEAIHGDIDGLIYCVTDDELAGLTNIMSLVTSPTVIRIMWGRGPCIG